MFDVDDNELINLEGCPNKVGEIFYCRNNKIQFTKEDIHKVCDVKGNVYV
jgi:hypothetical protein